MNCVAGNSEARAVIFDSASGGRKTRICHRNIVTPPADPDDDPEELVLASLRLSLQQVKDGKLHPIEELWSDA